jgi:phenylpyruvate tautomerase PptA (4-oxalocrotonate tautomerase family)
MEHVIFTCTGENQRRFFMPLFTCITQEGTLSADQRALIASEFTRIYAERMNDPAGFVRVNFETVAPNTTFTAGKPSVNAYIIGYIRLGHGDENIALTLQDLWSVYKKATGLGDDQLLAIAVEVPANHAMEYGPGGQAAGLPLPRR